MTAHLPHRRVLLGGQYLERTVLPATGTIYVSSIAFGGIAIGDDTNGNGTLSKPYLTVDKAVTSGSEGNTIALNGNPASPTDYRHATFINLTKGYSFQPVFSYGAIISSTSTGNRVIACSLATGQTATFGKLTVDGRNVCTTCITTPDQSSTYTLNIVGTKLLNFTQYGCFSNGSATKANINYTNAIIASSNCRDGIRHLVHTAGAINISGTSVTLTSQNLANNGGILIETLTAGVTVSIDSTSVAITLDSSLTGAGTHFGMFVYNTPNVAITNSSTHISGTPGSRAAIGIQISTSSDVSELDCSNAVIRNCQSTNLTNGGRLFAFGTDTQTYGLQTGSLIEDCTGVGSATFQAGGGHGIFTSNQTTAVVRRNKISYADLGIIDKLSTGGYFYSNIAYNCTQYYYLMKGSTNCTMKHNTSVSTSPYLGIHFKAIVGDDVGLTATTGGIYSGNLSYNDSTSNGVYVIVDTGQTCTFSKNDYFSASAAATNPWQYQGNNYNSLVLWQGAQEATALGINPVFTNFTGGNYDIPSSVVGLGVVTNDASIVLDYLKRAFASSNNSTIGAFQQQ